MTEKRFTYLDASKNHYIGSFFCNSVPLTNKEVVDLLNENEQLKSICQDHKDHAMDFKADCGRLEKENEQLKKLLECSRKEANDYCEELISKDEFIRLYKSQRDELKQFIKQNCPMCGANLELFYKEQGEL